MSSKLPRIAVLMPAVLMTLSASAQDVSEICKSVPIIFKDTAIQSKASRKTSYKRLICSASWKSYQDVVNAGVDVTVPIYNIPIPLSANYSRDKQELWQSQNCDAEERTTDWKAEGFLLAKEINPVTSADWLACVEKTQEFAVPRALSCKITETETSAMFETKWRPVEGALSSEAPLVQSLDVMNTKCHNAAALKKGTKIGTGGIALLCNGNTDKAPMFVLNTNRGSCSASGALASRVTLLSGKITLQSPMIYRGDNLRLAADLIIVTNGNSLTIDAKRLTIDGSPVIKSFEIDQGVIDRRGDSAGEIRIRANKIDGGQLVIENFGQNGGTGSVGGKGNAGLKGFPAARRHWRDFEGCVGGHNGGPGGKGESGRQGSPGAPGGNGGDVLLDVRSGLQDGVTQRVNILVARTDRANNPMNCGGTCPGLPGIPGDGGPGGDGGQGGDSAGGDAPCGGRDGGPAGPAGDKGPPGPEQSIKGAPGRIVGL